MLCLLKFGPRALIAYSSPSLSLALLILDWLLTGRADVNVNVVNNVLNGLNDLLKDVSF